MAESERCWPILPAATDRFPIFSSRGLAAEMHPNFDSRDPDFDEDPISLGGGAASDAALALGDAERRHKDAGFNTQRVSKLVDVQKRDVPLPPLDRTHVSAVDTSPGR